MGASSRDVMDRGGRGKRLLIALVIGAVAGVIAYLIALRMVDPNSTTPGAHVTAHNIGPFGFITWVTAVAAAMSFMVALRGLNRAAKRR